MKVSKHSRTGSSAAAGASGPTRAASPPLTALPHTPSFVFNIFKAAQHFALCVLLLFPFNRCAPGVNITSV